MEHAGVVTFYAWLPSVTKLDKDRDKEIKYAQTDVEGNPIPQQHLFVFRV